MSTLREAFFAAGLLAGATQAIGIGARHTAEFRRLAALAALLDLELQKRSQVDFDDKTLLQETARFFDEGKVRVDRLGKQDLAKTDRGSAPPVDNEPSAMGCEQGDFGAALPLANVCPPREAAQLRR